MKQRLLILLKIHLFEGRVIEREERTERERELFCLLTYSPKGSKGPADPPRSPMGVKGLITGTISRE